jgi:Flp pilus assembly protein TadG
VARFQHETEEAAAERRRRRPGFWRGFANDESGIILPYMTLMLVVLFGLGVLALDGARFVSLQTQLQNGADAYALAAAAELDGAADAITRADRALTLPGVTTNKTLFSTSGSVNVTIAQKRYLKTIPNDATIAIDNSHLAANAGEAKFVEIQVTPTSMSTILPASYFGGSNTVQASAAAVAGLEQAVCNFTPLFICNPYETAGMTSDQATQADQAQDADRTIFAGQFRVPRYADARAGRQRAARCARPHQASGLLPAIRRQYAARQHRVGRCGP